MDGWFLTFDRGAGRPSVFAFVDDLVQSEIDTLHVLLLEEVASFGATYEAFSSDFLLIKDRATLVRFRREWRAIHTDLTDPTQSDGELMHRPWFELYYLYLEFRDEVIALREFDEDEEDDDKAITADEEMDAIVEMIIESQSQDPVRKMSPDKIMSSEVTVPRWDSESMILFLGKQIARRVSMKAKNVLAVLNAFQEDGWPFKIDDPLPGGRNPERLRDTLKQLNKDLKHLRFSADGSGEGIVWTKGEAGEITPLK
jgi:hypothetical protein